MLETVLMQIPHSHKNRHAFFLTSNRLLDQLRERIQYLHYSFQTENAYPYWVRFFIRWHGRGGVMRHPREMGSAEVEPFL